MNPNLPDIVIPANQIDSLRQHSVFIDGIADTQDPGTEIRLSYADYSTTFTPHLWGIVTHTFTQMMQNPLEFSGIIDLLVYYSKLSAASNIPLMQLGLLEQYAERLSFDRPITTDQDQAEVQKVLTYIKRSRLNAEEILEAFENGILFVGMGELQYQFQRNQYVDAIEMFKNSFFTPERFAEYIRFLPNERAGYLTLMNYYANAMSLNNVKQVGDYFGIHGGKRRKSKKTRKIRKY
jgi:hypothetical protein